MSRTFPWAQWQRSIVKASLAGLVAICISSSAFGDDGEPSADDQSETVVKAQKFVTQEEFPDVAARENPNKTQPPAPFEVTPPPAKSTTKAGSTSKDLEAAMKGAYKGVYYANDFSYLNDPAYRGPHFFGDSFKGMLDNKLDIGGEYRSRYHHENNHRGYGLTGLDDQFWLTRLRMFANYRMTENIRLYGEYLYADSGGETFAPRQIEENRGEAQNLFVETKLFESGGARTSARLGRQELLLGDQRLVAAARLGKHPANF